MAEQPQPPRDLRGLVLMPVLIIGLAFAVFSSLSSNRKSPTRPKSPTVRANVQLRPSVRRDVVPTRRVPGDRRRAQRNSPSPRPAHRPRARKPYSAPSVVALEKDIPFVVPIAAMDKAYRAAMAKAKGPGKDFHAKQLLSTYLAERLREATMGNANERRISLAATRFLAYRGLTRYQQMGYWLMAQMEQALKAYADTGKVLRLTSLHDEVSGDKVQGLAKYLGNFPALFRTIGVSPSAKALTPLQLQWLRVIFFTRWARQVVGHYSLPLLFGKAGYPDYLRLRILFSRKAQSRLWATREMLRAEKTFPGARTFGWLFFIQRKYALSRGFFKRALKDDPKDRYATRMLKLLPPAPPKPRKQTVPRPTSRPASRPSPSR